MKTLDYLKVSATILVLFLSSISCSTANKTAVLCPELPRNNLNNQVAHKNNRHNKKVYAYSQKESNRKKHADRSPIVAKSSQKHKSLIKNELNRNINSKNVAKSEKVGSLNMIEYKNNLIASTGNSSIPLVRLNNSIDLNVESSVVINKTEPYSSNTLAGTTLITKNKSEKLHFKSAKKERSAIAQNGTLDSGPKIEPLGLAGMIVGIVGIFFAGIPCGIIAIVFGAISLSRINKHPEKYKGLGFAIASLSIGIVVLLLTILLLAGA
jgi:hypothetical protein